MNIPTISGALIAAVILFFTGLLALLQQEGVTSVGDINQVAWIVLGVGAFISFLKDFQALSTRRVIGKLTGSKVNSPAIVGVLALILAALTLSGCAGTGAAYKSAEGLSETAYVVGEHYYALVRATNDLDDKGQVSSGELRKIQNIARETRPTIVAQLNAASAYENAKSAYDNAASAYERFESAQNETALEAAQMAIVSAETELSNALATAAFAVSRLVDAIKEVGASTRLEICIDHAQRHARRLESSRGGIDEFVNYCTTVASR